MAVIKTVVKNDSLRFLSEMTNRIQIKNTSMSCAFLQLAQEVQPSLLGDYALKHTPRVHDDDLPDSEFDKQLLHQFKRRVYLYSYRRLVCLSALCFRREIYKINSLDRCID